MLTEWQALEGDDLTFGDGEWGACRQLPAGPHRRMCGCPSQG
jgi:hypothetical protein